MKMMLKALVIGAGVLALTAGAASARSHGGGHHGGGSHHSSYHHSRSHHVRAYHSRHVGYRSHHRSHYYTNVDGNRVHRPVRASHAPSGASARCGDGTYSFSEHHQGTCSHHGGVSNWL